MKLKCFLASLLCAAASVGHAQSVQVYGLLDTGIEYINNIGATKDSMTRMPNLTGGQLPSRLGFRGSEDLGDGLKAVFTFESGLDLGSGTLLQSGRMFGRQSFVGLSGPWGTATLGRHWTMAFFSLLDADVIGPSVFSLYALDIYPANARVDNSLSYRGTFAGLSVGATYSLGRDTLPPGNCAGETNGSACAAWSAMAKYDASHWGVALAYDEQRGGGTGGFGVIPGRPAVAAPNSNDKDKRTILDGYWKVASGKIGAGWIKHDVRAAAGNVSTNLYFIGASYPVVGLFSVDVQYSAIRNKDMNADADNVVLRANYALSKRTSLYALTGHVKNKGTATYSVSVSSIVPSSPVAGGGQSGLMVGMRHSF